MLNQSLQQFRLKDINKKLKSKLMRLTLKKNSALKELLKNSHLHEDAKIYVLFEDDIPIAWLAAVYDRDCFTKKQRYHIGVYVKTTHRKHGLGTYLIRQAKKDIPKTKITAMPFDKRGIQFFHKNKISLNFPPRK